MDALLVYLPWESLVVCCYGCTLVPLTWESVVLQMVDAFLVNLLCKMWCSKWWGHFLVLLAQESVLDCCWWGHFCVFGM